MLLMNEVLHLTEAQIRVLYESDSQGYCTDMTKPVVFVEPAYAQDVPVNRVTMCLKPRVWDHPEVAEVQKTVTMRILSDEQVAFMADLYGRYNVIYV